MNMNNSLATLTGVRIIFLEYKACLAELEIWLLSSKDSRNFNAFYSSFDLQIYNQLINFVIILISSTIVPSAELVLTQVLFFCFYDKNHLIFTLYVSVLFIYLFFIYLFFHLWVLHTS